MIVQANVFAGWVGFLLGCVSGAITGLFFYGKEWLGGYSSWQRRMVRLGHISFFGIGLINLLFALTVQAMGVADGVATPSILLNIGAVSMPALCYLSAWKPIMRHLFFIPALSVTVAIVFFIIRITGL